MKFETMSGDMIHVNPRLVAAVGPARDMRTTELMIGLVALRMSDGSSVVVKGVVEETGQMLEYVWSDPPPQWITSDGKLLR